MLIYKTPMKTRNDYFFMAFLKKSIKNDRIYKFSQNLIWKFKTHPIWKHCHILTIHKISNDINNEIQWIMNQIKTPTKDIVNSKI